MDILSKLNSRRGERGNQANKKVASLCLAKASLLDDIAKGLKSDDPALLGDLCEVFTEVGKTDPSLVAPYADAFPPFLKHKVTKVRWESMHAIALCAAERPELVLKHLKLLNSLICDDKSIIVRSGAILALGNAALAGNKEARKVHPSLMRCLEDEHHRHISLGLDGLLAVVGQAPKLRLPLLEAAERFMAHPKKSVVTAAKRLRRVCEIGD